MKQKIIDTGKTELVSRPNADFPYSTFDHSHDVKTCGNFGQLIPVLMKECLPGDVVHLSSECLCRLQPLLAPVMGRATLRLEYFFVPNRLLWENWENLISPPEIDSEVPPVPCFSDDLVVTNNSLANQLGLPINAGIPNTSLRNVLPFAAYAKIYTDWYYDQNFENEGNSPFIANARFVPLNDGDDNLSTNWNFLQSRNWDRDYFTSALPWPQKGPDVVLPIYTGNASSAQVPLSFDGSSSSPAKIWTVDGQAITAGNIGVTGGSSPQNAEVTTGSGLDGAQIDVTPYTSANLLPFLNGQFTGTINDLRTASAVQSWLEADSFGTRYIEVIQNQWGTTVEDFRLQRAEYLGSTTEPIQFSEVLQTSETGTTPQANMAGHGIAAHFRPSHEHYHCSEHGFCVVLLSVLPATGYVNGIDKMWNRTDRMDYPWPFLAHTGYQEILNQEVYYDRTASSQVNQSVWGYQPRYQEYRTDFNKFRSNFATDLVFWQMNRVPTSLDVLNSSFIQSEAGDSVQIFADTSTMDTHLIFHILHRLTISRKLPKFAVPRLQ